jgi:hypothetical protein
LFIIAENGEKRFCLLTWLAEINHQVHGTIGTADVQRRVPKYVTGSSLFCTSIEEVLLKAVMDGSVCSL